MGLEFPDPDVRRDLKDMCCEPMQFCWDNHLLAPTVEWEMAESTEGALQMCFLKGFRLVRKFLFFERDQTFYECPFCRCNLIKPLGYRDLAAGRGEAVRLVRMGEGMPSVNSSMTIPKMVLHEALLKTKARSKTWPPKN